MGDVVVNGPVSWNHVVNLDELPEPSSHMQFATGHHEVLGGTSAGKAAHLRELGIDVELHTVLGTDPAADRIDAALRRADIGYVAIRVAGPSERHLNLMDPSGRRVSIYLDVPAVSRVDQGGAAARLVRAASGARALILDLSQPSRDVISTVASLDVPIWTDLHDYDGRSSFHQPFLQAARFVFMNADRMPAPADFLRHAVEGGARIAVCTLGAHGAVAVDTDLTVHAVPAVPVAHVVDVNGAGDGFMAGFVAAHLRGADVRAALRAGAAQAARALTTIQLSPRLDPSGAVTGRTENERPAT